MGGVSEADIAALSPPELLADRHDISAFACGENALDDWLRRRARANQMSGASGTYVLAENDRVVSYYSIAAGAIAVKTPGRVRRNMPDPIPMAVLGRLAIDRAWQRKGLGRLMLRDVVLRISKAAQGHLRNLRLPRIAGKRDDADGLAAGRRCRASRRVGQFDPRLTAALAEAPGFECFFSLLWCLRSHARQIPLLFTSLQNRSRRVISGHEPGVRLRSHSGGDLRVCRRSLPAARSRPAPRRGLDCPCEIFLHEQRGRTDQHRTAEECSAAARGEPAAG